MINTIYTGMKRSPLFFCLILLCLLGVAVIPAAASPKIISISPSSGPNNGDVSVTITGSGFNSDTTTVWMTPANKCDGENKIWGAIKTRSANTVTATFSLSGKTPAPYRLWVNSPYYDDFGKFHDKDEASSASTFEIYKGTGASSTTVTTTATTTVTATVTTSATSGEGENSVFFETNPPGATIYLDHNVIGISTFTYYTNKKGVFDIVAKKAGYEDYQAKVTILEGVRTHFYAPLTQLASGNMTSVTKPASGTPAKPVTTIQKSTMKIPTPLGTYAPAPEESPVDPALALGATALVLALVVIRRR
jgi:hypothetical protein